MRWFESFSDEFTEVIVPMDDINFLVIELADDVFDSSTTEADTGTDRVDTLIITPDRDLCAIPCFTRNRTDFNGAV